VNTFVKTVLIVCFTSALTFTSASGSTAVPEITLTFAAAWTAVQEKNDALLASMAEVEQAEYKQDAAKSLYLPEIDFSASYIYLDDKVELSPDDVLDSMEGGDQVKAIIDALAGGVGLSPEQVNSELTSTIANRDRVSSALNAIWPIYTGGQITAAQNIAAGKLNEAKYNLKLQLINQFENLVRYYFGAVLAQQVHETRKRVEAGLKEHRDHAVLLEKQGQIARVERLQAEASFDKAVVERKKAGRDLDIARVALSRMLKSSELIVPSDTLFISEQLPSIDTFLAKTINTYPGLGVLDSKKEQVAGLVDIEKGKYLPTVALFGSYSLYEEDDLLSELVPDWFMGVGVTFQLLDRSGRSGQLSAARSTMQRLNHLELQAKSDLSVLVEQTYRHAEQAQEEYHGLGSSVKLAEEMVNLRSKAFSQGLSTSLDVVDAEMFLAGVKTQRAVAVYNYIVSLGKILAVSSNQEDFFVFQNSKELEGF